MNALKAFSVLAETGSYSRAGSVLNVTHAAIMQQIRALETHVGEKLVRRAGRGVELTSEGVALARELDTGFRHFAKGLDQISEARKPRPVQITMSPAFAVKWLMPRLAEFQQRHPEITLLLNPTGRFMDLKPGGIEIAIRYRRSEILDGTEDVLFRGDPVVVATPSLLASGDVSSPADLVHLPWLQELGTNEVADWLARHGVALTRPLMISHMPGNLIMDAVKRGDGVTYTLRQWVVEELRKGELVELFPEEGAGVFFIHTLPGGDRKPVTRLIDWLKEQAAEKIRRNLEGSRLPVTGIML